MGWWSSLDGTAEGVLQGLITDEYGEQHLAWIAILIVPVIGCNIFSAKTSARKGNVSIFDVNKPRLEAGDITLPIHGENDDLYSFKLDLSADGYRRKGADDEYGDQCPSVAPAAGTH